MKLIDADALKAVVQTYYALTKQEVIDIIDSLPDLGCARGQAHSGTQWCAEAVEMGREIERLKGERGSRD